jgi:hypothetical protein
VAQVNLTDEKYRARLRRRMTGYEPLPEIEQMLWAYAYGKPRDPNMLRRSTPRPSPDGEA